MSCEPSQTEPRPLGLNPALVGTAYCIASAIGYTAANICLRQLSHVGASDVWAICIKEVVTVAVVGPWLAAQLLRGAIKPFALRWLAVLAVTGLAVQLAGNLAMQWAFGVVGLAVTMPATFGVMITGGALLGWWLLGERVSPRSMAAIAALVSAIVLLGLGAALEREEDGPKTSAAASTTSDNVVQELESLPAPTLWRTAKGVGAACMAGMVFALLSIAIRTTASRGVPITVIVFVITGMGVASLGTIGAYRFGAGGLLEIPPSQLIWMLAAGTFNLLAFLAISKGLQLTTVVHANVLNASQIAMGVVAGITFFHESWNAWLLAGIGLTIAGVVLIGQPQAAEPEVPGA